MGMKRWVKWFFRVRQKIYLSYFIVVIIMASVSGFSFYQIKQIEKEYDSILQNQVSHVIEVQQLQNRMMEEIDLIKNYALTKEAKLVNEIEQLNAGNKLTLEAFVYKAKSEKEKEELATLKQLYMNFTKDEQKMISAIKKDNINLFLILMENKFAGAVEESMTKVVQQIRVDMNEQKNIVNEKVAQMKQMVLYANLVNLIITALIAYGIAKNIADPVNILAKHANYMAEGDLTKKIPNVKNKDEIGDLVYSFQNLQNQLKDIVSKIQLNAEHVASTSLEISASSEETTKSIEQITMTMQDMAASADEQVNYVRKTSENVNDFRKGITEISQNANEATLAAGQTSLTAKDGFTMIEQAKKQMNEVGSTVNRSVEVVTKLSKQSAKIGEIVDLITNIAEQTNLLALNAAIEAARAGEHGRGFAIVADEVRKLAEQSANAAHTISDMIEGIKKDTASAVEAMIKGDQEVKEGISIVDKANQSFEDILTAIDNVALGSKQTMQAAKEMEEYVDQVIGVMAELEKGIENNAGYTESVAAASEEQNASIEEISSSIEQLSHMAEELNELVNQFKIKSSI